jgi:hypothetical protein
MSGTKFFKGQNLWYNLMQFSVVGLFITFLLLRVCGVDITKGEIWGYIFYAIFIGFVLTAGQMWIKQRHQDAVNDVKVFFNGKVRRSKVSAPKMVIGFEVLEEINVDFGDLSKFEEGRKFQLAKQEIIKKVAVEDFHGKRKLKMKDTGKLRELIKNDAPLAEIKRESQKREGKKRKDSMKKDVPYESLDIKKLGINVEKLIQEHRFYFGLLYEEERFDEKDIPFKRAFVIVKKGKKQQNLLETRKARAYDKDAYPISINVVDTYCLVIDWVLDSVPILFVKWTENMISEDVEEVLKVEEIEYIQNVVTRHLLNHIISLNKQPKLKIDRLKAEKKTIEDEYYLLLQDLIKQRIRGMGSRSDRVEIERLNRELRIGTRNKYIAYTLVGILIAISVLFAVLFFRISIAGPTNFFGLV